MSMPAKPFNPWPWAIVAFFTVAVCGVVAFVIFCNRHGTDLVARDYYEQELRHQQQMDRARRAAALATPLQVAYDAPARAITLRLPEAQRTAAVTGSIQLYRPSAAQQDRVVPLRVDAGGGQTIDASALSDGLWHVRVTWSLNGEEFFHDQKLVIGAKPT
jgi:hypothetical protein